MTRLLMVLVLALVAVGCSNPYMNPVVSKAVSEQEQLKEAQKQTALIERQTVALEKIAERCGR